MNQNLGEGSLFTLGSRVAAAGIVRPYQRNSDDPFYRPLQIYALDPSISCLQGAVTVVKVPYEPLQPGPVGKLIKIVDQREDGSPQELVDLDDPRVLIMNGRTPSPGDRLFRQQMVYAVVSLTYAAFQRALGRQLIWGFTQETDENSSQLQIRTEAAPVGKNAYYAKDTGELVFGHYEADQVNGRTPPKGMIYTCLSHDIIAHETSHALLHGLRANFEYSTNPDVAAFHEAFADLVAVFQHFSYRDVVLAAMQESRGEIRTAALLTDIARQFGYTTRADGQPLRTTIDVTGKGGIPVQYKEASQEPHALGTVLTSAVFEAFITVFERRIAPYVRLATGGSGQLPPGELPADLLQILAKTAQTLAEQFLIICIRAIDYCPPVDIEFGEYLRAVITADHDLVQDDPWGYREAWIDAFARRGIFPSNVPHLVEDTLLWRKPGKTLPTLTDLCFGELRFNGDPAQPASPDELRRQACALGWVVAQPEWTEEFGCTLRNDPRLGSDAVDPPCVESIRTSRRVGPDGEIRFDLVAEVIQRRWIGGKGGGEFYGGATVIIDPYGKVRYVIRKSVLAEERVRRMGVLSNG